MLQGLLMGDRLVAMPRFHPGEALRLVASERVTILVAVPTASSIPALFPTWTAMTVSLSFICASGGAACPPSLARKIRETLGCALYNGFGMTEAPGGISVSSLSDSAEQQDETVGKVIPGIEARIVDGQRRDVPAGQAGELAVRGEGVMLGYYRTPELTATVKDDEGWLYTGDMARIDEKGYLHISRRAKDIIIRGGQNIYPAEIESWLESHPKIAEAAVVGVPSRVAGESVWAFVRPKSDRRHDRARSAGLLPGDPGDLEDSQRSAVRPGHSPGRGAAGAEVQAAPGGDRGAQRRQDMKDDSSPIAFEEFRRMIARELHVDEKRVQPNASFVDDLYADSIRLVEMMLKLKEQGITIPMEEAWNVKTVEDAYKVYSRSKTTAS